MNSTRLLVQRSALLLLILLFSRSPVSTARGRESFLASPDDAVLVAPEADFSIELRRIKLSPPPFAAKEVPDSISTELGDLRDSLKRAGAPANRIHEIVDDYEGQRMALKPSGNRLASAGFPADARSPGEVIAGLPTEFADYLDATRRWCRAVPDERQAARHSWESLLALPPEDRHFKSTWAAYMLGRSWESENPKRAIDYFERTRQMARAGFADSLGLAAESLGREGRVFFRQKRYARALELYLEQLAAGDASADVSLRFVIRDLVSHGTDRFPSLIQNRITRRLVTAYFVSTTALRNSCVYSTVTGNDSDTNGPAAVVSDWLALAEQANVDDPESVEELALAAYQNGQGKTAQRWISQARNSPVAQWLEAKLLFRAGKLDEGGALLRRLTVQFPLGHRDTNTAPGLKDDLSTEFVAGRYDDEGAARQIRGELGVYDLARGNYSESLSAFLEAASWMDAAYVAERVMTVDELKGFVDAMPAESASVDPGSNHAEQLRYLLARRLTRELRGNEARDYYPSEWRPVFDSLAEALLAGWNESLTPEERARALFDAARITRTNGMELLGTELGPDWRIYDGEREGGLLEIRRTNRFNGLFPASADELGRASSHKADPEVRFHYRYQAAALAWEAARRMPNNSDETARVLWLAGSWLKNRDPDTADLFYKALVRRNRGTALGAVADRMRWFPASDDVEEGVVPAPESEGTGETPPDSSIATEEAVEAQSAEEYPMPGTVYVVHAGDTLAAIVEAVNALWEPITIEDLLEANPGLAETRLKVGMRLEIPAAGQESR